jgi:hypothetical protein
MYEVGADLLVEMDEDFGVAARSQLVSRSP